jgi:hypothetical protein
VAAGSTGWQTMMISQWIILLAVTTAAVVVQKYYDSVEFSMILILFDAMIFETEKSKPSTQN